MHSLVLCSWKLLKLEEILDHFHPVTSCSGIITTGDGTICSVQIAFDRDTIEALAGALFAREPFRCFVILAVEHVLEVKLHHFRVLRVISDQILVLREVSNDQPSSLSGFCVYFLEQIFIQLSLGSS